MSEELKPCYHCGKIPQQEGGETKMAVHQCSAMWGNWVIERVDVWQIRPIEDELRVQLDVAMKALEIDTAIFDALVRNRIVGAIVLSRSRLKGINIALAKIAKLGEKKQKDDKLDNILEEK